jgi:hypothetical protein
MKYLLGALVAGLCIGISFIILNTDAQEEQKNSSGNGSFICPPGEVPILNESDNTQAKDAQGNPLCETLDIVGSLFS